MAHQRRKWILTAAAAILLLGAAGAHADTATPTPTPTATPTVTPTPTVTATPTVTPTPMKPKRSESDATRECWGPFAVSGNGSFPSVEGIDVSAYDDILTAGIDAAGTVTVAIETKTTGGVFVPLPSPSPCTADCEVPFGGPRDRVRFTVTGCTGCTATTVGLCGRRRTR